MTDRKVTGQDTCWSGSALAVGDYVKFADGGGRNRAFKCGEIEADGICTFATDRSWVIVTVDVLEPRSEYWDYDGGKSQYLFDLAILQNSISIDLDPVEPYDGEFDAEELACLYVEYTQAAKRFVEWALARLGGAK